MQEGGGEASLLLLEAARYGEEVVVRELLLRRPASNGGPDPIDLNVRDGRGNTALHMASANGHLEIVRLLLEPSVRDDEAEAAAATNGHRHARLDVNARNEHGNTALHWVATQPALTPEHRAIAELLLESRADPNARNDRGRTPLNEAADRGHTELCELLVRHEGRLGEAEPAGTNQVG